ncbi:hypothetical protein [Bradyrhizobium liaoningense]|uniref:hypothetical protein n=1 Tax=Bradyrhizobium liaoningense TaxID=43992 RepID=UPI001BAB94C2|nr:hypothetical protein [Bradyrhizobium liaoningense]MBR0715381.1 hypothetical protein [Bradyrhizobium liaoningense]
MSEPNPPAAPPVPPARGGCLTALMVICGVILLLPGLCAIVFGGISVSEGGRIDADIAPLVFLGLVVGAVGVALIWVAIKGRRS